MNTDAPDTVRRDYERQLLQSMVERQEDLKTELRQRLDTIEQPEVRIFAAQLAEQTLDRHRQFCRQSLLRLLPPDESVIVIDQLSAPALPVKRPRWKRLVRWTWRRLEPRGRSAAAGDRSSDRSG